jgi:hypothetical protein
MSSKITDLTAGTTFATGDFVPIVDVSDLTQATTGTTKKYTISTLSDYLAALTQTLTNKTLTSPVLTTPQINDTSLDHQYIFAGSELTADRTVTLPLLTGNDTFVFADFAQTLNNKVLVHTENNYSPAAAATATLDLSNGILHKIQMPAGNITIAVSNETVGQYFMVEIVQDDTGSRTVTWFTTINWMDGDTEPTLTTTADRKDTFGFRVTAADTYDGYIVGQDVPT